MEHKINLSLPEALTLERSFRASVEKVWQAITDKEQMKKWYFDLRV